MQCVIEKGAKILISGSRSSAALLSGSGKLILIPADILDKLNCVQNSQLGDKFQILYRLI